MIENFWQNIVVDADDPEIGKINELERSLGKLLPEVLQIRELITRFEVCHFKYQWHLSHIKEAIKNLKTEIDPDKIGASHFRNGPDVCINDKSGRSRLGLDYVEALKRWLNNEPETRVSKLLGKKAPDKEKLVRLLIARLDYDWKAYEEASQAKVNEELKLQASRMDVCHYAFPKNMDQLLKGIGQLKLVKDFEGCGSSNSQIKGFVEKEFSVLNNSLRAVGKDKNAQIRTWLTACLAKTLKEQIALKDPIALTQ
jgi:hypothetical protein